MRAEASCCSKAIAEIEALAGRGIQHCPSLDASASGAIDRRAAPKRNWHDAPATSPYGGKLLLATGAVSRRLVRDGVDDRRMWPICGRTRRRRLHIRARLSTPGARHRHDRWRLHWPRTRGERQPAGRCEVTVLEVLPRLLPRRAGGDRGRHRRPGIAADGGRGCRDHHRQSHCGRSGRRRPVRRVSLSPMATVLEADLVIIGIGAVPDDRPVMPKRPGWRSTTVSRWTSELRTADPRHLSRRAIAARFRLPSMAAVACGSSPGAMRRSRAMSRRATCWALENRTPRCPGSGRTSTT